MKTAIADKLETCRQTAAELRWNEKNALISAEILISKALWMGLDEQEAAQLISELPSAGYVRQNLHILREACTAITAKISRLSQPVDEFDRLLNGEI